MGAKISSARGDGIVVFRASDYYSNEQCNSIAEGGRKRLAPVKGQSGASQRSVWRQTEVGLAPDGSPSRASRKSVSGGSRVREKRETRKE